MKSNVFVFCDVDETLINEKSMFTILKYLAKYFELDYDSIINHISLMLNNGEDREHINRFYYKQLKGLKRQQVIDYSNQYFREKIIKNSDDFFIESTNKYLKKLINQNVIPVFVSGSSSDYLQFLANYLSVPHILATKQMVDCNGQYTGDIAQCMIGEGKKQAVINFAKKRHVDLSQCYGMGDHISDLHFLELVGTKIIKSGNKDMEEYAYNNGYEVLA